MLIQTIAMLALGWSCAAAPAQAQTRWHLADDGGVAWNVKPAEAHQDNVEMSGKKVSVIVTYGVDAGGKFTVSRQLIWPMLRFQPNKTHDHFTVTFANDAMPNVYIDQLPARNETLTRVWQKGILRFEGVVGRSQELSFARAVFPSVDKPAVFDVTTYTNRTSKPVSVAVEDNDRVVHTQPEIGIYGSYDATSHVLGTGLKTLKPGESMTFAVVIAARRTDEAAATFDVAAEEKARRDRLESFQAKMQLETPNPILNTEFSFAKIRIGESIYQTKVGPMHGPGGATYYAAIWCNDTAEYACPYYGYSGDELGVQSAMTCYRLFASHMNPDYKPIPSSIISEGSGIWNGAGDRGDMAMLACGASRFALVYGKKETAEELWPLIEWCLEYCRRKIDANGVVASDSDELENRFPSGKANLATSSLYFDALNSAVYLGKDLGKPAAQLADYAARSRAIHQAIEHFFGAKVEGFDTYRYFDKSVPSVQPRALERHAHYANEPDHLRAWIGVALAVGIDDRADATIDALLSPKLWTADGMATESGKADFWDRSTLYTMRGIFAAGGTEKAIGKLIDYSTRRLLGEHVPYPVEANAEGDQRQLSAEDALYCRIFLEGMFGIRPTGLHSFNLTPRLPKAWPSMALKRVHAFGHDFDLTITRTGEKLSIQVVCDGKAMPTVEVEDGETTNIALPS